MERKKRNESKYGVIWRNWIRFRNEFMQGQGVRKGFVCVCEGKE